MSDHISAGVITNGGGTVSVGGDAIGTQHVSRSSPEPSAEAHSDRADVGVLTVLTEELRAVVGVLQRQHDFAHRPIVGGAEVFTATVGGLRVVATQTTDRGNRSAAIAFDQMQRAFAPRFMLLVGIAGGIKEGLNIGDVVIAEEVIYHDARRLQVDGTFHRGQGLPITSPIRRRLNEFFRRYGNMTNARVLRGPIGSGDAVVMDADAEIVRWLRNYNEKVLAVETEGAGFGQAFYEHIETDEPGRTLHGWLVIRGVSDLANAEKGHDRHQFAAVRAAAVMDRLIPLLHLPE